MNLFWCFVVGVACAVSFGFAGSIVTAYRYGRDPLNLRDDEIKPDPVKELSDRDVADKMHAIEMWVRFPTLRGEGDRRRFLEVSFDDLKALYCAEKITFAVFERYVTELAKEKARP